MSNLIGIYKTEETKFTIMNNFIFYSIHFQKARIHRNETKQRPYFHLSADGQHRGVKIKMSDSLNYS